MKKLSIALLAGGIVAATVFAMAASLGLSSDDLGAGDAAVASCDDAVNVTYTTLFDSTDNRYEVDDVNFELAAGCADQAGKVTLTGNNALNVDNTFTAASGSNIVPFAADDVPAEDVLNVHMVITGDQP